MLRKQFLTRVQWFVFYCLIRPLLAFSLEKCCIFDLRPYKSSLPLLSLAAVAIPFGVVPSPSPIFLANPSPMHRLAWGSSHGPNLVIQHIPPSIKPCTPTLVPSPSFSLRSLSHFPFLLLSNCQAAPGPARHLRHRLLILLDHRKKHVCL